MHTTNTAARPVATPPPVQAGLLGIEPAPLVHEVKFAVVGQLQSMAEVRISADGEHAHLIVQIMQPPHGRISGVPIVAIYHAHASEVPTLQAQAARLQAGAMALVVYRGLDFDAERRVFHARRCDCIDPISNSEASAWLAPHLGRIE